MPQVVEQITGMPVVSVDDVRGKIAGPDELYSPTG